MANCPTVLARKEEETTETVSQSLRVAISGLEPQKNNRSVQGEEEEEREKVHLKIALFNFTRAAKRQSLSPLSAAVNCGGLPLSSLPL